MSPLIPTRVFEAEESDFNIKRDIYLSWFDYTTQ